MSLRSVQFEVFGRVQGVFFRKHTRTIGQRYSLVGWVQNTSRGTVVGVIQGEESHIGTMKQWLSTVGSPKSRIDRCEFSHQKTITKTDYSTFTIRK